MAHIERIKKLEEALRKKLATYTNGKFQVSVIVGYTAGYALFVHENLEMKWKGLPRDHTRWTQKFLRGRVGKGKRLDSDWLSTAMTSLITSGKERDPARQKARKELKQPRPKGYYWDPQGQARSKFLEFPARELAGELGWLAAEAFKNGKNLLNALYIAGLHLQRASQSLVPVDTGNLKGSAFTRKEQ
jgi:hypothetical protein